MCVCVCVCLRFLKVGINFAKPFSCVSSTIITEYTNI